MFCQDLGGALVMWEVHPFPSSTVHTTAVSACCKIRQLDANTCMCSDHGLSLDFSVNALKRALSRLRGCIGHVHVGGTSILFKYSTHGGCFRLLQNATTGCKHLYVLGAWSKPGFFH